jgi:photosystem II stability/assembly factor-like uncharacterized protein
MKKNILLTVIALFLFINGFSQNKKSINKKITTKKIECVKKANVSKETLCLQKQHEAFLKKSPFKKTLAMTKNERKSYGLPPDKYYEQEWELTMNPQLGYPTPEKVKTLRADLEIKRKQAMLNRTPGDANDNAWVDRGPTNVGGRTRALMFDPNDPTNETVYAGSVAGGLWKNSNISNPASLWSLVNMPDNLTVSCIVADPNNPSIFYVGTGESYTGDVSGDGVWKSTDAGLNWFRVLGGIGGVSNFNSSAPMTVNSPATISGNYATVPTTPASAFGTAITSPLTGSLVLAKDASALPTECCNPPLINSAANSNSLVGKIALIRRGNCAFVIKVKAAQDAGAIAVVMMNNVDGAPAGMGGTDPDITIPSIAISKADGNLLEVALSASEPAVINVTLNPTLPGQFSGYNVPGIQTINDIKIRNNAGISEVYVAVGDAYNYAYIGARDFGLYKTTNGGSTWSSITLPLTASGNKHCPNDIAIGADNKVWVATTNSTVFNEGGGKIFGSNDGINFNDMFTVPMGERVQIAASKTVADKLYVLSELKQIDSANPGIESTIIKTTDGFNTHTILPIPVDAEPAGRFSTYGFTGQQAFFDLLIDVDPTNDETIYVGGIDLFKSTTGGNSWNQISHWYGAYAPNNVHSDQHGIAFAKNNSSKVIFGNDGGVFYSTDAGNSISSRNKGYNVTQFYSVAVAPGNSGLVGDYFASGAQDNGSQYFANPGPNAAESTQVQSGDGAVCLFDQGTDKYYITNYVYNDQVYYRTTAGGSKLLSDANPGGAFIAPMALDSSRDVLYSDFSTGSTFQVRRYGGIKTSTVTRTNLTNALLNSSPSALLVSKFTTSSSKLYIGTRGGRLLLVPNANSGTSQTWTDISVGSGFVGSISDIELGASEGNIFVTMHNYGVVSVWYSADGGTTWENKEGNLPDIPVKCILQNPLNAEEVIVGTDLGVWFTNNFSAASPSWRQSDNGMRNVKVTDMDIKGEAAGATSYTVFASTFGRGVFSGLFTAPSLSNDAFETKYGIKLYPNPSNNGLFNLSMKDYNGKLNIQVTDLNGRLVYNAKNTDFNTEKSIDLSAFQSGIYILKINNEDMNFSKKLIKN